MPLSAQLSLSVPPLVKKISALVAPITSATCLRAFSIAALLAWVKLYVPAGLAYCSVRYGIMASSALPLSRVVAALSI